MVIIQRKIEIRNILGDKFNKQSLILLRNWRIQTWEFIWNTVIVFWKPETFAFMKNSLAIYAHSQVRSRFIDRLSGRTLLAWNMIHLLLSGINLSLFCSFFLVAWISFCKDLVRCQIAQVANSMFCYHFRTSSETLFILLLNVVRFALSMLL